MIGQKQLLNKLNNFTIDTFPRSILLLGEKGSGRHLIVNYIQKNIVNFPMVDLTNDISSEVIDKIYRNPNPTIYIIDLSKSQEKEQNILLKFIEEPLNNSFIILLAENKYNLLNTIVNRCFILELDKYTKEELLTFSIENKLKLTNEELIFNVIKTPGQLLNINLDTLQDTYDLCLKIINKIDKAIYSNTLTIANKINYKDEYNKFDLSIFLDTLSYALFKIYQKENDIKYYKMYILTIEYRKKLIDSRLNKEYFMQNYLTQLWKMSRGVI